MQRRATRIGSLASSPIVFVAPQPPQRPVSAVTHSGVSFLTIHKSHKMKTFFILSLLLLVSLSLTSGFSPCSANNRVRGVSSNTSNGGARLDTCLHAAAPKKKAAKKKTTKKAAKDSVETFKKSDFVSAVKDKTGLSKVDAEAALNAVLDTISEVRSIVMI